MQVSMINMKKFICLFAIFSFFLFPSCENADILCKGEPTENMACTDHYDPVCGCDKVTYGNECHAIRAGVLSWKNRKCF